ncbi:MAG: acetolactate synthase small subunit [Spirochaetales bacterium]|nr:acetolactate synthase small subunit [Spirochaetales bacterium]
MMESNEKHLISLYVSNKPGVLIRIALVFAKRGYNIDSLVVSPADNPHFSRMIITASGDPATLEQILKQLNKLIDVVHAQDNTAGDSIQRELALIKVKCTLEQRTELFQYAHVFGAKPLDMGESSVSFQITDESSRINAFHKLLEKFEILETVRTGKVLILKNDAVSS